MVYVMQWDLTMLFTNLCVLLKRRVALNQLLLKDFGKVIEKWGEVPLDC
jgi:DNA phosphorothioation-dependent restriction protein DptG